MPIRVYFLLYDSSVEEQVDLHIILKFTESMGYKEIWLFQYLEIPDSFEEREGRFSSADQTESSKECCSDCTNKSIKDV